MTSKHHWSAKNQKFQSRGHEVYLSVSFSNKRGLTLLSHNFINHRRELNGKNLVSLTISSISGALNHGWLGREEMGGFSGFIPRTHAQTETKSQLAYAADQLAEHWVNNLIKPIFLIMMFVRVECEEEFGLHLYACKKMLPYFFSAGHRNYARDGLVYIRTMEKLPRNPLD